jgi:hypothetical protein
MPLDDDGLQPLFLPPPKMPPPCRMGGMTRTGGEVFRWESLAPRLARPLRAAIGEAVRRTGRSPTAPELNRVVDRGYSALAPQDGVAGPEITAEQRDALYEQIFDRMRAIDDVWMAASTGDYASADRLGREYRDVLSLVLDDLGWGDKADEGTIRLTTSADALRRVFVRLEEGAIGERAQRTLDRTEIRQLGERDRLVGEARRGVLRSLGAGKA